MFDVSFSELVVIGVVALIVIGPEKLPKVARTLGALTGRMQRYMTEIKEEVNREVRFEELQQLQQEIKSRVDQTEANLRLKTHTLNSELDFRVSAELKPVEKKKVVRRKSPVKVKST